MNLSYVIVDFKGEVLWSKLKNNTYAVDPIYLELFLRIKNERIKGGALRHFNELKRT